MNIDFEAALTYINLGSYEKAIEKLKAAINKETESENPSTAAKYRCVLGELYANLHMIDESRAEFEQVLDYCDDTLSLHEQRRIAETYLDIFDGKMPMPEQNTEKRPGDVPVIPKPVQNRGFIERQSRRNHR